MNFVLWLVKRAWKPVVEYWNNPAIEGKNCSGKEDILSFIYLVCWACGIVFSLISALWDVRRLWITLLIFGTLPLIVYGVDAYKYLSKLHAKYRTEHPDQEKPKRKAKYDEKEQTRQSFEDGYNAADDWVEHSIGDYFEEGETK